MGSSGFPDSDGDDEGGYVMVEGIRIEVLCVEGACLDLGEEWLRILGCG